MILIWLLQLQRSRRREIDQVEEEKVEEVEVEEAVVVEEDVDEVQEEVEEVKEEERRVGSRRRKGRGTITMNFPLKQKSQISHCSGV